MDVKEFPIIKVEILFSWNSDFDAICEDLSSRLLIAPDFARSKGYCKVKEYDHNYWGITEKAKNCRVLSYQTDKIANRLKGKEAMLINLANEYGLTLHVNISVHAESGDGPEIVLTKDFVEFAASIGADIGFDMYYYESEDEN